MREQVIEKLKEKKIIAIVRGQSRENVLRIADALYAGGVCFMEITYNAAKPETNEETAQTIAALRHEMGSGFYVGAGTVLTERQVDLTREAGGRYIISPNVNEGVIRHTVASGLVSIPGAMTPTECEAAHRAGADFVKLFPIGTLGAGYLKAIAAPLSHISFLAVGGVTPGNMGDYFRAGAVGLGTGGDLIQGAAVAAGQFDRLTARAREYVAAVREATEGCR